jgi:hypothetical protein
MAVPVAACRGGGGRAEEFADLGPGEFLVAGVVDGLGQELSGLGDEAGQRVQPDGGVAEPVGGASLGEAVDRLVEDVEAVVVGPGSGQLAGAGEAQRGWPPSTRPAWRAATYRATVWCEQPASSAASRNDPVRSNAARISMTSPADFTCPLPGAGWVSGWHRSAKPGRGPPPGTLAGNGQTCRAELTAASRHIS